MATAMRWLTLAALAGLALFVVGWALGAWPGAVAVSAFALFALPLVLPLRGMLANRPKAYVWGALIALLYLLHGLVTLISSPGEQALGVVEAVLATALLLGASLHARWLALQQA